MSATKRLSDAVRGVLSRASVEGNVLRLSDEKLERKLYVEVAGAIEAMGGKWNRKAGAHLFEVEVAPLLAALLDDGVVPEKNPDAFFETPPDVVRRIVDAAVLDDIPSEGLRVLEPSAGNGAIARELWAALPPDGTLDTVELNPRRADVLRDNGFRVHEGDFLAYTAEPYDLIAMNPPFAITSDATAWITHVRHALTLLKPGGRLIAIVPAGMVHRTDKRHQEIRTLLDSATVEPLHPDAFKASGTGVNACLVVYDHPVPTEVR